MEGDLRANIDATADQRIVIGQIAKTDSTGRSTVSIYEQTKDSPQFKEDLRKAVAEVTRPRVPPPSGLVRVQTT